jgi:hypothetical protein
VSQRFLIKLGGEVVKSAELATVAGDVAALVAEGLGAASA